MNVVREQIARNLADVRQEMAAACRRAARSADSVTLVAVTKYAELEWVQALTDLGVSDLGESRPQQLVERVPLIAAPVRWHLIGHLQRNKARKVLPYVELVHSVDSFRLLTALEALAEEQGLTPRVLLEVNVSGEATKDGFQPDELLSQIDALAACRALRIEGLMTMAPLSDDLDIPRQTFRALRLLRDSLQRPLGRPLPELSMGMSHDFPAAIEEGATLVRIGSRLFEGLPGAEH